MDNKKTVYIGIGVPGSGKSTWWAAGCANGTIPSTAIRINMDTIRKELTGSDIDQTKNDLVAKIAKSTLDSCLLHNINVIYWDNTSAKRKYRKEVIEVAKKAGYDVIGVWFDVPLEVSKGRNASRDRKVPDDVLERMYDSIKSNPPTIEEGFDQIIVVK